MSLFKLVPVRSLDLPEKLRNLLNTDFVLNGGGFAAQVARNTCPTVHSQIISSKVT